MTIPRPLSTVSDAVAAGAALLDERRPGWWREIDIDTLDLGHSAHCIVGQLYRADGYGDFRHGIEDLGLTPASLDSVEGSDDHRICLHGFGACREHCFEFMGLTPETAGNYYRNVEHPTFALLDAAWHGEIAARRAVDEAVDETVTA